MRDLSALTPPLLVCAVVIIAIVAFLRHEMNRSRADRSAAGDETPATRGPRDDAGDREGQADSDAQRSAADDSRPHP